MSKTPLQPSGRGQVKGTAYQDPQEIFRRGIRLGLGGWQSKSVIFHYFYSILIRAPVKLGVDTGMPTLLDKGSM